MLIPTGNHITNNIVASNQPTKTAGRAIDDAAAAPVAFDKCMDGVPPAPLAVASLLIQYSRDGEMRTVFSQSIA